jgi:DUF4097 and DUF4098 domain-containing protein YvlB
VNLRLRHPGVVAAIALGLLLLPRAWAVEDQIKKSFTVAPGGRLEVHADRGSIEVTTADTKELKIVVEREAKARNQEREKALLADHEVTFDQQGDTVVVKGKLNRNLNASSFFNGPNLKVRYLITTPRRFNVELKTAGGSITISDIEGETKAGTSGGSIKVGNVTGTVRATTAGGSIHVAGATGDAVTETSGGSITLGNMQSEAKANTAGGSIEVQKAGGPTSLGTSGGSIRVKEASSTVHASTAGGSITVNFAKAPPEASKLETSGGGITVQLPEGAALDLDAETSGGGVTSDLPVTLQGKQQRNVLRGKLNGGGQALTLRTSGGGIHVKKGDSGSNR